FTDLRPRAVARPWVAAAPAEAGPAGEVARPARHERQRGLELGHACRPQKVKHTAHDVGVVVMAVAGMLDRVLAAPMRAPLKQAQLANNPPMIGHAYKSAREGW